MSENVHEKFTGPFERILLQNVGHFPQREDSEAVSRELAVFLQGQHRAPNRCSRNFSFTRSFI